VQVLANSGLDFVTIDGEHGTYSMDQIRRLLDAARSAGIAPIVRVVLDTRGPVVQVMDGGAAGILFPQICTIEDVHRAVAMTKYPPIGQRGMHFLRPHTNFVLPESIPAFCETANADMLTIVQIETVEAANIVDQIAAVDGVDMLYFGPTDMTASLGAADVSDPRIKQTMVKIAKACRDHGKIAATQVIKLDDTTELMELGFQMFGYRGAVVFLAAGATDYIGQAHKAAAKAKR
jgi:2-keto-3-deoxy-L-rhamnonate aldolase RhmA